MACVVTVPLAISHFLNNLASTSLLEVVFFAQGREKKKQNKIKKYAKMEQGDNNVLDDVEKSLGRQSVRSTDTSMQEEELTTPALVANKDLESGLEEASGVNLPQYTEVNGTSPVTRIITKSSWIDPGPPPDGGIVAWSQCA